MKYPDGNRPVYRVVMTSLGLCTLAMATIPGFAQAFVSSSDTRGGTALPDSPGYQIQQAAQGLAGTMDGTVADARGGLVPGASVTLEEKGHGKVRETATDGAGHFKFGGVAAGTYTLLVTARDLKTFLSQPITVADGQHFDMPEIAMAVASSTSVDVSANSVQVAERELNEETKQRVIGVFPNFYTSFVYDAAPLNTKQKFKLTFRSVADPTTFIAVGIVAAIEQERNTFPDWGNSDAASYGKRYAAAYGDDLLSRTFSYAIYPAIFHQDPRYFYMGPGNKVSTRFWHAALSGVITRGDNGHNELNYSHLLGSGTAGALSSFYHPASDSAGYLAGLNMGVGIAGHGVQALIREFVLPHFTTHVPKYAKSNAPDAAAAKPATSTP